MSFLQRTAVRCAGSGGATGVVVLLLGMLSLPPIAAAALGADVSTVAADGVRMKATVLTTQQALYSVHEMLTPSGTTVREFVAPSGWVFAVTWQGPFLPDLRQTLGTYFEAYQSAPRSKQAGRTRLLLDQPDLVVHSVGHPRAFFGRAYVPKLVPAGVAVEQLQ
jgi:hypothetical protein